jgi:predicted SnoaL-like aldol condensation-catalyzing enzyme
MNNKEKAHAVNKAVMSSDFNAIERLVREDYIQHTANVSDGRSGLQGLLTKIRNKEIPVPQIKTVRTFEDGEFVVLHHDVKWPNRKAMFEIFRFENGLAAEHWSCIADHPEKTASGNSMVDGATEIKDRDKTSENKKLVREFVETVLIKGEFDKILNFYHPDVKQHNPYINNTVDGLINGVSELQRKGIILQLQKVHRILGEGNFVLVVSEGLFAGKPTAFYDLFCIENGKVVEHWDVIQEIPSTIAHDNGVF